MDYLTIDSTYGHYSVTLSEIITKGIGYIEIDSFSDLDKCINEAITLIKRYKPKEIIIGLNEQYNLEYEVLYTIDKYKLLHKRYKINKDYKLIPLTKENRYEYTKIANSMVGDHVKTYSDGEIFRLMNSYKMGYIRFSKKHIGIYMIDNNEIVLFYVLPEYNKQFPLERVINTIDDDIFMKVVSTNLELKQQLVDFGFSKDYNCNIYYKKSSRVEKV